MPWFIVALASPFLWAITNHIDKYVVAEYSKRIKFTSFVMLASLFICIPALGILIFKPEVIQLSLNNILLVVLGGLFFEYYLFPYYFALEEEEASIITPMFQMVPILSFIFGFLFLRERLETVQITAGVIIILGSIGLSLDLSAKIRLKAKVFFLLFLSSAMVSTGVLLYKFVAIQSDLFTALFWQEVGIIFAGLILFTIKKYRENFLQIFREGNTKFIGVMGINELLTWAAGLIFSYSYLLAPIALVQLVGSVQPLFVLVLGILGAVIMPRFTYENTGRKFLTQKIIFIVFILVGSYLLFSNL
jgi:uncharacterized membrane protein